MHKIVALWAVPRSTSTAFEWMMRQRGDMDCLHEPFGEAWYQGEKPLWQRFKEGDKITPGLTLETVWEDIKKRAELGPVFKIFRITSITCGIQIFCHISPTHF